MIMNKTILGLSDKDLGQFYLKSRFDYNISINEREFTDQYPFFKETSLVSWVPKLVEGFNQKNMNIEQGLEVSEGTKLSAHNEERLQKEAKELGLEPDELRNITEFVNVEIKANESKDIISVFKKMFKDIQSEKLRRYMMASVSYVPSLSLEFVTDMVI